MSLASDEVIYEGRERESVIDQVKQQMKAEVLQFAVTRYNTEEAATALLLTLKRHRASQVVVQRRVDPQSFEPLLVLAAVSKNQILFMYSIEIVLATKVGLMDKTGLANFTNAVKFDLKAVTDILEKTHNIPGAEDITLIGTITKTADDIVVPEKDALS